MCIKLFTFLKVQNIIMYLRCFGSLSMTSGCNVSNWRRDFFRDFETIRFSRSARRRFEPYGIIPNSSRVLHVSVGLVAFSCLIVEVGLVP